MSTESYRVSVVIPVYNLEQYIDRALKSVLAQTRPADEIIVIDDGSTDGTAEIVKKYHQVHYVYQENTGLCGARNAAIKLARCEWIAFLDGDDSWEPEKLQLQLELLCRNRELVWVGANFVSDGQDKRAIKPKVPPERAQSLLGNKEYFDSFFAASIERAYGNCDTMMVRTAVLKEVGGFDEKVIYMSDWDLWMRIAYRWPKIGYISRPLARYYVHRPGSLTSQNRNVNNVCFLIRRHLILSCQVGQLGNFKPCAQKMLRGLIRRISRSGQVHPLEDILDEFASLLSWRKRAAIRLAVKFPPVLLLLRGLRLL